MRLEFIVITHDFEKVSATLNISLTKLGVKTSSTNAGLAVTNLGGLAASNATGLATEDRT